MATTKLKRIDIGFQGGQILPARVEQEAFDGLRAALTDANAERWHQLQTPEAEISIDLSQVVYLRVDTEEQRVGF
jgi:hypothetical protein